MPGTIYLAVEDDELELPVFVGDTRIEIEEGLGLYRGAVSSAIKKNHAVRCSSLNISLRFYQIDTLQM